MCHQIVQVPNHTEAHQSLGVHIAKFTYQTTSLTIKLIYIQAKSKYIEEVHNLCVRIMCIALFYNTKRKHRTQYYFHLTMSSFSLSEFFSVFGFAYRETKKKCKVVKRYIIHKSYNVMPFGIVRIYEAHTPD